MRPKFSVPFNGDPKLIDFLIDKKRFVEDVYFGMPNDVLPSGRVVFYKTQPRTYLKRLLSSLKRLRENNIQTTLVVNRTCEGEETFSANSLEKHRKIICMLIEKNLLSNVVLSNPIYLTQLKKEFPQIKFEISVNSSINSMYRAKYVDKMGFDVVILDRDINHNKRLVRQISGNIAARTKMLVNECCLNECVYRTHHFNLLSHHTENIKDYKERVPCVGIYGRDPWKLLKSSFILPRDLEDYDDFVDIYKLSGRELPTVILKYMLNTYFERKAEGDLLAILSSYGLHAWKNMFIKKNDKLPQLEMSKLPSGFRQKVANCDFECEKCKYCKMVWENVLTTYDR